MAKPVRVKIYNKGDRRWPLVDNGKDVELAPNSSIELNKDRAEKLIEAYPKEFLLGEPVQRVNDNKKLRAENEKLTKENAELRVKVAEYEELIESDSPKESKSVLKGGK